MRRRENDGEGNKRRGMQTGEGGRRRTEGEKSRRRKRVMQTTEGCRSRTEVERRKQAGNKIRGCSLVKEGEGRKETKERACRISYYFFIVTKFIISNDLCHPLRSFPQLRASLLIQWPPGVTGGRSLHQQRVQPPAPGPKLLEEEVHLLLQCLILIELVQNFCCLLHRPSYPAQSPLPHLLFFYQKTVPKILCCN